MPKLDLTKYGGLIYDRSQNKTEKIERITLTENDDTNNIQVNDYVFVFDGTGTTLNNVSVSEGDFLIAFDLLLGTRNNLELGTYLFKDINLFFKAFLNIDDSGPET